MNSLKYTVDIKLKLVDLYQNFQVFYQTLPNAKLPGIQRVFRCSFLRLICMNNLNIYLSIDISFLQMTEKNKEYLKQK